MVNVPTSFSHLKTKVDDLDIGKSEVIPVNLKKVSEVVDNEVVRNTNISTPKAKINNLEKKKIPEENSLIDSNKCNTSKQRLDKKSEILIKNTRYIWSSDYNCF